jgi:hypothetical protein
MTMDFEQSMQAAREAKQRRGAWIREQVDCGHIVPCTKPGDACGCQPAPQPQPSPAAPEGEQPQQG